MGISTLNKQLSLQKACFLPCNSLIRIHEMKLAARESEKIKSDTLFLPLDESSRHVETNPSAASPP